MKNFVLSDVADQGLRRRTGFTLIELLVAIAIMVALMGIALYFTPKTESRNANQGADQAQTFIASARSRAMRDNILSGVRLVPDSSGYYREFQFIQAPEPYAPINVTLSIAAGSTTASFTQGGSAFDVSASVQVGDLLEIMYGVGSVHRVASVGSGSSAGSITLASVPPSAAVSTLTLSPVSSSVNSGFRFIREPRPLMGETSLQLPQYVRVDNTSNMSQNLNTLVSYQVAAPTYDIIFAPSGQVVNCSAGRVVLWIDDDNGVSAPTLLCIYTRTGGVAAQPVAPPPNSPYFYTQDGKGFGQ